MASTLSMPNSSLGQLMEDFQSWRMKDSPEYATTANVYTYNHQLESQTLPGLQNRKSKCEDFLGRLQAIEKQSLQAKEQTNFDLLHDYLQTYISGYRWRFHGACNPVDFLENIPIDYESFLIEATPFANEADFHSYVSRLHCIPSQIDQQMALMKEAISRKTTLHRVSVDKVPKQLEDLVQKEVTEHPFYEPCRKHITIVEGQSNRDTICATLKDVIQNQLNPAFERLRQFLVDEYFPNTRTYEGVWCLPEGKEFYKACLKWHLSDDITPDEIHNQGLSEVTRLRARMHEIMNSLNFQGTLPEFFTSLKENQAFYHKSKKELLSGYKDIVEKRINPKLLQMFHCLPSHDCEIREMPFNGPAGQYNPTSEDGSRPGVFLVNLTCPETIPKFGMTVLTLHEVNPGHHFQISHAIQQDLPDFRKKIDYRNLFSCPLLFPTYTAYCEGWALYAEDLGVEMDIYSSPYEMFGKLTEEMFRACRLVVDTGLHWMKWSKEQAMNYMNNNCMLSENEVEVEVCRYITWPGQACAYKIGHLKIKSLRELAEKELGPQFSIKDFHELILNLSCVPLYILEAHVKEWIETLQKKK